MRYHRNQLIKTDKESDMFNHEGKKSALLLAGMLMGLLQLQGCAQLQNRYQPLPKHLEEQARLVGPANVRDWGDQPSKILEQSARTSILQEKAAHNGTLPDEVTAIALSGGGSDGAFGAGLLCGWTAAGTRPQFKVVTGISTGALMAPFAFLGSAYDPQLKTAYTTISDKNIYSTHNPIYILLSLANIEVVPSLASNHPLAQLIAEQIDEKVLKDVAAEHLKGRRLLVGTTQLNAERLVIWDMGAIANSGAPDALALFRQVLLASASLPGSFPPQYFKVKADGKSYDEMHVDGGVEAQVMLFENALRPFSKFGKELQGQEHKRTLYIIRNQKVHPEWKNVTPQLKFIATRAINSITVSQGVGDLYRLYAYAQRDHFDYRLAYVPPEFTKVPASEFDQKYMQSLFDVGYEMGRKGQPWHQYPPDFEPL
jgi:predicted acylesterase/phospholipase RssA